MSVETPSRSDDGRRSREQGEVRCQTAQHRNRSSQPEGHEEPCRSRRHRCSLHGGHGRHGRWHSGHHVHLRSGRRHGHRSVCRRRSHGPVKGVSAIRAKGFQRSSYIVTVTVATTTVVVAPRRAAVLRRD